MNTEPQRFWPLSELARRLEKPSMTVRSAILAGHIPVEALLIQQNRRPVAMFSQKTIDEISGIFTESEMMVNSNTGTRL